MAPTVAIIVLDGEVSLYAETLRYLAWKLANEGARIVRFGCTGELPTCTSLNSTNKANLAEFGKAPVCARCKTGQENISAKTVFEITPYDSTLSIEESDFLSKIRSLLQEDKNISNIMNMKFDGIDLTRLAFFDFAIQTKLSHFSVLDEINIEKFIAGVTAQLILLRALKRFYEQKKITHVLYVNGNYSLNSLIRVFFEKEGVICVNVEPQPTSQDILNKILLTKERLVLDPDGMLPASAISPNENIPVRIVEKTLQNFGKRIYGKEFNAYTSLQQDAETQAEIIQLNTFTDRYSRIHSFFLSSEDELTPHIQTHGALSNGSMGLLGDFSSQMNFTRHLLLSAANYPEVGFIVRLHPRMAVNKRDHFESEEHRKYKKLLSETVIPDNVFVIYGDSKISSYYVISESDLVIISWSTIGIEALLLNKPVISVFPAYLMYPLTDLSKQPKNKSELKAALFSATDYGVFNSDFFIRWLAMAYEGQFFATAAPRTGVDFWGKIYHIGYRFMSRHGLYDLVARMVSLWPSARVKNDDQVLLQRNRKSRSPTERNLVQIRELLSKYRLKHLQQLNNYGHGSQQSGQ